MSGCLGVCGYPCVFMSVYGYHGCRWVSTFVTSGKDKPTNFSVKTKTIDQLSEIFTGLRGHTHERQKKREIQLFFLPNG